MNCRNYETQGQRCCNHHMRQVFFHPIFKQRHFFGKSFSLYKIAMKSCMTDKQTTVVNISITILYQTQLLTCIFLIHYITDFIQKNPIPYILLDFNLHHRYVKHVAKWLFLYTDTTFLHHILNMTVSSNIPVCIN